MKSLVLTAPHSLEMTMVQVPLPGPSQVLIRIAHAAICHTDFVAMAGEHSMMRFPTVLGHEFSGVIEECGESVEDVKPGDRVTALSYSYCGTCPACRRGLHTACRNARYIPFHLEGAYQNLLVMPTASVYPIYNDNLGW